MAIQSVPSGAGIFGQGVSYPLEFTAAGRLALSSGPTLVEEALESLFQTQPGERPMEPDYGCGVHAFEPIDLDRAQIAVSRNITDHEPRIERFSVEPTMGTRPEEVILTVRYYLHGDATARVLTHPYFVGP